MSQKDKRERMGKRQNDISKGVTVASADSSESAEKYERELSWCVKQLQLGLESQNANTRQAQEAVKVLKILQSSKAPMVKKRQAMHNSFGDYRKKMQEEDVKSAAAAKKVKLSSGVEKHSVKSQFFKKSVGQSSREHSLEGSQAGVENRGMFNQSCEDVQNTFKFNFNISTTENDGSSKGDDNEDCNKTASEDSLTSDTTVCGASDGSNSGCRETDENGANYAFERSDNTFKFNFTDSDET